MASPSPLGRRARRRKADIARRVCAAARAHAAEGTPVSTVPLDQLLSEAGVPRSTFYVYFSDRAAVFAEVLDQLTAFTLQAISSSLRMPATKSIADFRATLVEGVAHYRAHEGDYRLLLEVAATEPRVAEAYRGSMERASGALAVAMSTRRGTDAPTTSDIATAAALIWMLERTLYQVELDDDALADAFTRIFWGVAHPAGEHLHPPVGDPAP